LDPVDLDRLIRDLIQTYPNGHQTEIQIRGKLPRVLGNAALLTQCFSNLLSNAAKFVSPETVPHIEVWSEDPVSLSSQTHAETPQSRTGSDPGKGIVRIWVEDNGIGIAPENHDRIFGMFERVNPVKEYEGTGIGLAIVRKAATRIGAQFGCESELGEGSQFWIQLQKA
jgi:signal transduction histidine kinase